MNMVNYSIRGKSDLKGENKSVTSGLNKEYITTWSYGVDETFNHAYTQL